MFSRVALARPIRLLIFPIGPIEESVYVQFSLFKCQFDFSCYALIGHVIS